VKILIDVGHPGHVHFFKNAASLFEKEGHEVLFVVRGKDVTVDLMNELPFTFALIGKSREKMATKAVDILLKDYNAYRVAKGFEPDVLMGIHSPYMAHVSKLLSRPCIIFSDTELVRYDWIVFPFATYICTPHCYRKDHGRKHIRYNGYHELAYLHPRYFQPNDEVLGTLGVQENGYAVIRLISWNAYHDTHLSGMDRRRLAELIRELEKSIDVLISSEGPLPEEFEMYRMRAAPSEFHSVLHYASICVSEGSTTAIESAILGTPSVHIEALAQNGSSENSGTSGGASDAIPSGTTSGVLRELQEKYGLLHYFSGLKSAEPVIKEVVENRERYRTEWGRKVRRLVGEKTDVPRWMVMLVERL